MQAAAAALSKLSSRSRVPLQRRLPCSVTHRVHLAAAGSVFVRSVSSHAALNPYEVLDVSRSATAEEIKAAYRLAALRTHPDRTGGSAESFKQASRAYQLLSETSSHVGGHGTSWNGHGNNSQAWQGVAPWQPDIFGPFRTVSMSEAERLFRAAFGGRSVEEVLQDASAKDSSGRAINHGLHSTCIREATFNELLREAQKRADAQRLLGAAEKTTTVSREKMTTEDGRGFMKVKMTTYWRDGRVETDVTMKELYRL